MIDTQKKFAEVVGEAYTNVRNVLGRRRGPRQFIPSRGEPQHFVVADALAWRIVRKLTHLGMTWDEAAEAVRRERCADFALRDGIEDVGFFAVWEFRHPQINKPGAHRGTPSEIAEIVENDIARYGGVANLRMVSLRMAYVEAELIAEQAGYTFDGHEIGLKADKD